MPLSKQQAGPASSGQNLDQIVRNPCQGYGKEKEEGCVCHDFVLFDKLEVNKSGKCGHQPGRRYSQPGYQLKDKFDSNVNSRAKTRDRQIEKRRASKNADCDGGKT